MTWTKLTSELLDSPAMLRLDRSTRLLHLEAISYCGRHLTGGVMRNVSVRRLGDVADVDTAIAALVAAGLWTPIDGDAWQIDWSDQETAADVVRARNLNAARQRRWRKHRKGDHIECDPKHCKAAEAVTSRETLRNARDIDTDTDTDEVSVSAGAAVAGRRAAARRPRAKAHNDDRPRCVNGALIVGDGSCCGQEHAEAVTA